MYGTTVGADVAISPNGRLVAYVTGASRGPNQIQLRSLDQLAPITLVPDVPFTPNPFFSPDGEWLGFEDDRMLMRVSVRGGRALEVCIKPPDNGNRGATWGADDTIIFGHRDGLWQVPVDGGGDPTPLTTVDREQGQTGHARPHMLPGGRALLFMITTGTTIERAQIAVLNLDTGEQTVLFSGGGNPRYSPTGHILYGLDGVLWAVGFDVDRLEVTTGPVPVLAARGESLELDRSPESISVPILGVWRWVRNGSATVNGPCGSRRRISRRAPGTPSMRG